jgi:hypothetical protein
MLEQKLKVMLMYKQLLTLELNCVKTFVIILCPLYFLGSCGHGKKYSGCVKSSELLE